MWHGLSETERALGVYEVHRRLQTTPSDWEPALCEVGIPEGVGYELVGSTSTLDDVGWVDDTGLGFGVTYCYRVVTRYGDGALSLASEEVCGRIRKDIPVMTRASIGSTGTSDSLLVGWSLPMNWIPRPFQDLTTTNCGGVRRRVQARLNWPGLPTQKPSCWLWTPWFGWTG